VVREHVKIKKGKHKIVKIQMKKKIPQIKMTQKTMIKPLTPLHLKIRRMSLKR